jgi:hypothetical protein
MTKLDQLCQGFSEHVRSRATIPCRVVERIVSDWKLERSGSRMRNAQLVHGIMWWRSLDGCVAV